MNRRCFLPSDLYLHPSGAGAIQKRDYVKHHLWASEMIWSRNFVAIFPAAVPNSELTRPPQTSKPVRVSTTVYGNSVVNGVRSTRMTRSAASRSVVIDRPVRAQSRF